MSVGVSGDGVGGRVGRGSWRYSTRYWAGLGVLALLNGLAWYWLGGSGALARARGPSVAAVLPRELDSRCKSIVLRFDRDAVGPEFVGVELAESPFEFVPSLAGEWRFPAADRAEFSLRNPVEAGKRWALRVRPELETVYGLELQGDRQWSLEASGLQWLGASIHSMDRQDLQVGLEFDQAVHPDELLRSLVIFAVPVASTKPQALELVALTREAAKTVIVRMPRTSAPTLRLELAAGLAGDRREVGLSKADRRVLQVPQHFSLLGLGPRQRAFDEEAELRLRFSEDLEPAQLFAGLQLRPTVAGLRREVQRNVLSLFGAFEVGVPYSLTLPASLESAQGRRLSKAQVVRATFPEREPELRLRRRRGILSPEGKGQLDVDLVNVEEVQIRASRVYPDQVVSMLRGDSWRHTSREVYSARQAIDAERNRPVAATLNLLQLLDVPRGVYQVSLRASADSWARERCTVFLSDLALSAHRDREGLMVWATSLRTGLPVAGAQFEVRAWTNQVLAEATSGPEGTARILVPEQHPDGPPAVILARYGEDLAVLQLDQRPWSLEDRALESGVPWPRGYEAALYCERGIYRPGATVRLSGLVREQSGALPRSFPLELRWRRPDGRQRSQIVDGFSAQGFLHADFVLDPSVPTGVWSASLHLVGDDHPLGSTEFLVEAFVAARLDLDFVTEEPPPRGVARSPLAVHAEYLFGAPAAGLRLSARGTYVPVEYQSDAWADYGFADFAARPSWAVEAEESLLDDKGAGQVEMTAPDGGIGGAWRSEWTATIHERGGRTVSNRRSLEWDPADAHLGLRLEQGGREVPVGAHTVYWVAVDGGDHSRAVEELQWEMTRIERSWRREEVAGKLRWRRVEEVVSVASGELHAAGAFEGSIDLPASPAGQYLLRLSQSEPKLSVRLDYRVVAGADARDLRVHDRPGRLQLEVVNAPVSGGEEARVMVRSPFPGTLWLCVETDRVEWSTVVEMAGEEIWVSCPVDPAWRHGAFVSATVVRGLEPDAQQWTERRAFGLCRLPLSQSMRRAALRCDVAERGTPGQPLVVEVQLEGATGGEVHLWAVDEGVLACTDFATPDPGRQLLAPARREVVSEDLYGLLLEDYCRPAGTLAIGAGEDFASTLRRSPNPLRAEQVTVLWSRAVALDAEGKARQEWILPEFQGRLRVMAVASDGDRTASTDRAVTVRAPLVVQISVPRFAAPGDRFRVPVEVFAPDEVGASVLLGWQCSLSGPVAMHSGAEFEDRVEDGRSMHELELRATGVGEVDGEVRAWLERADGSRTVARKKFRFGVRAAGVVQRRARYHEWTAGEPQVLELPEGFVSGTTRSKLRIGGDPMVEFTPALNALLDYPHGCVEQTTSGLHALLTAWEAGAMPGGVEGAMPEDLRARLRGGLARLWSMQTRDGGLAYWPGGPRSDAWGTAYAAEFLRRLQSHELPLEEEFLHGVLDFLEHRLEGSGLSAPTLSEQAHLVRVLVSFGRERRGRMHALQRRRAHLDLGARAHLASAWQELGQQDHALEALGSTWVSQNVRSEAGRLTSAVRQESLALQVLLRSGASLPQIPALAQRLLDRSVDGRWGSTLDDASAVRALVVFRGARRPSGSFEGVVSVGEQQREFRSGQPLEWALPRDAQRVRVDSAGSGLIHASLETVGLVLDAPEMDRGLEVRREWFAADGQALRGPLQVGDLIQVAVEWRRPEAGAGRVPHVAITDLLPAGLVVENPRLANTGSRATALPDRVEFLDDRVVLFTDASSQLGTARYWLRAMTAGVFQVPPIEASCMDEPVMSSVHGGGVLEILR